MFAEIINLSNYAFNWHACGVLTVSVFILTLGIALYRTDSTQFQNKISFVLYLLTFTWLFFLSISLFATEKELAYFWFKYFSYIGTAFISTLAYVVVLGWSDKLYEKQKILIPLFFIFPTIGVLMNFFTPYVVSDCLVLYHGNSVVFDEWGLFFAVVGVIPLLVAIGNLFYIKRKSKDIFLIRNVNVFILGLLVASTGFIDYIVAFYPHIGLYPSGYISIGIFFSVISYSIARYHFMDVESAVYRLFVWSVTSVAVGMPFGFLVVLITLYYGRASFVVGVILIVILLYLFTFVRNIVQPKIDSVLGRRRYENKDVLFDLIEKIFNSRIIRELALTVSTEVYDLFHASVVRYFVYDNGVCSLTTYMKKGIELAVDENMDISKECEKILEDPIIKELLKNNGVIYKETYARESGVSKIKKLTKFFDETGVEVIVTVLHQGVIVSMLVLDAKEGGRFYTQGELDFLKKLEQNLGLVVQNLVFFEGVLSKEKEISTLLEDRIKERTDELSQKNKELESLNQKTIDRELEMIKVKRKIKQLEIRFS